MKNNPIVIRLLCSTIAINSLMPNISFGFLLSADPVNDQQITHCFPSSRPLNPIMTQGKSAGSSTLDSISDAFKKAFIHATSGEWEAAISSYQDVWSVADCACDRLHALAGRRAARESWFYQKMYGYTSRPTQFFWSRFQYLTRDLPCIQNS